MRRKRHFADGGDLSGYDPSRPFDTSAGEQDLLDEGSFANAFRAKRAAGEKVFTWRGKKYTTDLAKPVSHDAAPAKVAPVPAVPRPAREDYLGPSALTQQLRASADQYGPAPTGLNNAARPVYGANWYGAQMPDTGEIESVAPEAYLMGGAGLARGMLSAGAKKLATKQIGQRLGTGSAELNERLANMGGRSAQVGQRLGAGSSRINDALADISRRGAEKAAMAPTRKAMGSATRSTGKEWSETVVKPRGMTPKTSTGETTSATPIRPRGMTPKSTEAPKPTPRPTKGMTPKSDVAPKPARPTKGMSPKSRGPDDAADDIRDVIKRRGMQGYAKGGGVRGSGIERRGKTRGRFV
jgi:hypothetical protein